MRLFSILLSSVVLFQGAIAAQSLAERLPACAVKCMQATLPSTTCKPDDVACLCADENFQTAAGLCTAANCTVVNTLIATNETYAACGIPTRDASGTMIGVTASIGGLAFIMVVLRLVDRAFSAHARLGWDDLLIGLAGFFSLFQNVPVVVAGALGFGKDMWGIPAWAITASLKWLFVTYFMYQVAEFLCQLSILAFYLRIMTNRESRITVWILMGIVTGFGLGNTFSMIFQCKPIPFFWAGWMGEMAGACTVDIRLFGFIRGGIEIALDLTILILPLPMLYKLHMSQRKKIQIMSMFCVGFVITVVSCLRLWALVKFAQTTNPTYDNVSGVYWCVTEANLFIVVACMPAMHAILQKTVPGCFGSFRDESGYGSKGQYVRSGNGKVSQKSSGSLPFGMITKSTDVQVYRTERSSSDVELVDRPSHNMSHL